VFLLLRFPLPPPLQCLLLLGHVPADIDLLSSLGLPLKGVAVCSCF
jgi:hypothetical protein